MSERRVRERPLILVADDEPDILSLVSLLLKQTGYDIASAADGLRAVQVARRRRPDAAVIDVRMPELDGYEFVRTIRDDADLHTLPVLLLSASVREEEIERGIDAGADDYLLKPFSRHELQRAVAALLSARSTAGRKGR